MDLLARLPSQCRIVVVRALQLGDLLCAIPALRSLRAARPDAQITLVSLPWANELLTRFPRYLDQFLEFPGFPGLPERTMSAPAVVDFLARAQDQQFDLAIQLHGSGGLLNPFAVLLGARRNAGFYLPGNYCPDVETYLPWPEQGHEIERLALLVRHLGGPDCGVELEFPLFDADRSEAERLLRENRLRAGGYVCIHPGGRMPSRHWSLDKFAAVAQWLDQQGLRVVVTGAPFEAALAGQLCERCNVKCVNLAGQTTLGGMGALLAQARLLVSNDTGVSHVAAALRVSSVVVVLGSDPARWAPLDSQLHRTVYQPIDCRPCGHRECPIGFPCEQQLSAADVIAVIEQQLADEMWSRLDVATVA